MRESCTSGSVRGARGNSRPYRNRREFIAIVGGAAAAWPIAARAQPTTMPVVAFLSGLEVPAHLVEEFRRGLGETGYTDGHNVTLEHHSAGGQYDRFRVIAGELVRRQVAVIFANGGTAAAIAAKSASTITPVVFY